MELPWSRGVLAALCVAICLPVAYAGRWDSWLGVWTETQKHVGTSFIFAIPVAAAVGAFFGAASARNGMDSMRGAAGRSQLQVQGRALLEPAIWTSIGYLIGSLPALVATAVFANYGTPRITPIVAQITCVAAVTVVGQVLGARMPWFLGAPLCAAVAYAVLGFFAFNADSILLSLTPIDDRRMTFEPVRRVVLVTQSLFWVSIVGHLVLRKSNLRKASLVTLFLPGLIASPLLYITPDTRGVDLAATHQRCEPTPGTSATSDPLIDSAEFAVPQVTICLPRGKEVARDQLAPEYDKAASLLAGVAPGNIAFVDDEAAGISDEVDTNLQETERQEAANGRAVIRMSRSGDISSYTRINTDQVHFGLIALIVPRSRPTSLSGGQSSGVNLADDPRLTATPSDAIWRWYLERVGAPLDGAGQFGGPLLSEEFMNFAGREDALDFISNLRPSDRYSWFRQHSAAIRQGTLVWAAFEAT